MSKSWQKSMDGFDSFVKEKMAEWKIPGMAAAVVKDGEVILSQGYGLRSIKENKTVTENTVFSIGSSSKAFTSMAAGILVDEGKLEWDAPVKKYIPWFNMYDPVAGERVTVRDMLCHRTGLPRHDTTWYGASLSRRELIERVRYLQPNRDFRSVWQYQNHMIAAVGCVVEEITGKTWETFVQEKIFEPLGMNSSSFSVEKSQQAPDYALPYLEYRGNVLEIPFRNIDAIGPAGSINSNIKDMTKWVLLNLNKGKYNGRQLISETNLMQLHTPQIPGKIDPWEFKELQFHTYGLAWFIEAFRGYKMIHHGGLIDGFSALVSFIPDENTGLVILSNMHERRPLLSALQYEVYDRLLGYEGKDWSKEIKEQVSRQNEMAAKMKENLIQICKQGTTPSHPLEAYTGQYENPGYGVITVCVEGGNLKINYNAFDCTLKHHHYDVFLLDNDLWNMSLPVTFQMNRNGDIDKLSIPFETDPAVGEIRFNRI